MEFFCNYQRLGDKKRRLHFLKGVGGKGKSPSGRHEESRKCVQSSFYEPVSKMIILPINIEHMWLDQWVTNMSCYQFDWSGITLIGAAVYITSAFMRFLVNPRKRRGRKYIIGSFHLWLFNISQQEMHKDP